MNSKHALATSILISTAISGDPTAAADERLADTTATTAQVVAPEPAFRSSLREGDENLGWRQHQRLRDQQRLLSSLWIFASLNYLYCDVVGLMDSNMLRKYASGTIDGFTINEDFLLKATILMQIPLSMVFLSTALSPRASRIANISAGTLMTAIQTATLFVGTPSKYYLFSSVVEIATTSFITAYAAFAMKPMKLTPFISPQPGGLTLNASLRF